MIKTADGGLSLHVRFGSNADMTFGFDESRLTSTAMCLVHVPHVGTLHQTRAFFSRTNIL